MTYLSTYISHSDIVGSDGILSFDKTKNQLDKKIDVALLKTIYHNPKCIMMLVDKNRKVRKLNKAAIDFSGKQEDKVIGLVGGAVLNCLNHLTDPLGCGFGPACADCKVKNTVMDTFEKRKEIHDIEGKIPFIKDGEEKELSILISTSLVTGVNGDLVLVKIEDITNQKLAEAEIIIKNTYLSKLNLFSIDISKPSNSDRLGEIIAKHLKVFSGAYISIFNDYDPGKKTLTTKYIDIETGILDKLVNIFGKSVTNNRSVVSDAIYSKMTADPIGYSSSLHEVTFGSIPNKVAAAIQSLLNIQRFIGIAHFVEGELYGTTLLAFKKDQLDPPKEVLENFAFLATESLRRKDAETKLRESEEKYKYLAENSSDVILSFGPDRKINYVSPSHITQLGYSYSESIGKDAVDISLSIHPDDKEELFAKINKAIDLKRPVLVYTYRAKNKAGNYIWREDHTKFSYDRSGIFTGSVVVGRDVTERMILEKKLKESEENLKNTFNLSPSIISKADLNKGYFLEANSAVTRILGYTIDEFTSTPIMNLIHPDDLQRTHDEILEQSQGKEVAFFENRYLCKDGTYKWMAWHGTKADKNGIVTAIGSDINQQKLAQLKLNQSTKLLEATQFMAKLGGWELDIPTGNLFWTAETYRIHDTSPEEFKPTVKAGLSYFLPESRRIISNALNEAIEKGKGYDLYLEALTTKGRRIDVRTTCEVTLIDGKPEKLTGFFQDVTDLKKAESELAKIRELLQETERTGKIGGWEFNVESLKQTWTDETFRILEIESKTGEAPKVPEGLNFIDPPFRTMAEEALQNAIQKGIPFDQEWMITTAKGNKRWVHSVARVFKEKGKIVRLAGSFQDITERKQAEIKLGENRAKLEIALGSMTDAIFISDKDGNLIEFNNAFATFHKFRDKDECSRTFKEYTNFLEVYKPNGEPAKLEEWAIPRALRGETATNQEYTLKRNDTGETWIGSYSLAPIIDSDKNIIGSVITARDITEQKKNEEQLKKQKYYLDTSQKMGKLGTWELDLKKDILIWTEETYKIFQVPLGTVVNYELFLNCIHPEDRDYVNEKWSHAVNHREPYDIEHRLLVNNKVKWVREKADIEFDEKGNPILAIGITQDITELIETELLIKSEKDKAQKYLDIAGVMLIALDIKGNINLINKKGCEILGYSHDEIINKNWFELCIHKEIRKDIRLVFNNLLAGNMEHVEIYENKVVTKSGVQRDIAFHNTIIRDPQQQITGVLFSGEDITDQKLSKEKLQTSEEKYRGLYHSIRDAILIADVNRNIIDCNDAFLSLFNYSSNEIIGKPTSHIYKSESEFKELGKTIKENYNNNAFLITIDYKKKSGEVFPGETNIFYLKDDAGNICGFIGLIRDISERKQAEELLWRQASLLQQVTNAIITFDFNNKILSWNFYAEKLFQYTKEEAVGKNIIELLSPVEMEPVVLNNIKQLHTDGHWEGDFNAKRKDKTTIPVHITSSYLKDINGENIGFIGVSYDITGRIKAEKELVRAKNKAEESDRLKSAFLANMSHEIRTPLNSIVGFSKQMTKKSIGKSSLNKMIELIDSNSKSLIQIIDDIIDISKIESGNISIKNEIVEVDELLSNIHSLTELGKKSLNKLNINLKYVRNKSKVNVLADKVRLTQVLNNLVSNALKYTINGAVELGYKPIANDMVRFYVKDTGIGISQEESDLIFSRFYRAENDMTTVRGVGLGLAITKQLVEKMDGEIWFKSKPNKGTTFYFTLPMAHSKESSPTKKSTKKVFDLNGKKILIAEDDDGNFLLSKMILEEQGAVIIRAFDGKQAVEICMGDDSLDLVLMDMKMPVMDRLKATRLIKEHRSQLPIIALSANVFDEAIQEAMGVGCDSFISKPVDADELINIMQTD